MIKYDIAISYVRSIYPEFVKAVAEQLEKSGYKVFLDTSSEEKLLDTELVESLTKVFKHETNYAIVFFSKDYPLRNYTSLEQQVLSERTFDKDFRSKLFIFKFDESECDLVGNTHFSSSLSSEKTNTPEKYSSYIINELGDLNIELKDTNDARYYIQNLCEMLISNYADEAHSGSIYPIYEHIHNEAYNSYNNAFVRYKIAYADKTTAKLLVWFGTHAPNDFQNSEDFEIKIRKKQSGFDYILKDYRIVDSSQYYRDNFFTYSLLRNTLIHRLNRILEVYNG